MPSARSTASPKYSRPELIVIAKAEAGLRALAHGVGSAANADTTALTSMLTAAGARMHLLFGLSEDRLRAQTASRAPVAGVAAEPPLDLALFYRVEADEGRLDQLAQDLRAHELVDGAYVKPAGEPPIDLKMLKKMKPDTGNVPPATPDFVSRQGYLAVAPGGVDAQFAWTIAGGGGAGVRIIDCEWAWRFTHEDLLQNQGGVVAGTSSGDTNHGTAVLGVISADRNSIGMHRDRARRGHQRIVIQRPVQLAGHQNGCGQASGRRHHPPRDPPPRPQHPQPGAGPAGLHRHRVVAGRFRGDPLRGAKGDHRGGGSRQRLPESR